MSVGAPASPPYDPPLRPSAFDGADGPLQGPPRSTTSCVNHGTGGDDGDGSSIGDAPPSACPPAPRKPCAAVAAASRTARAAHGGVRLPAAVVAAYGAL